MQELREIIIRKKDGIVHFSCAFCSRERKLKKDTFMRKPFCMSCAIRTIGCETAEESFEFLESEYENAKQKLFGKGLSLLETKQNFRVGKKSLCLCECGKKHNVLLSDLERESYSACPLKRNRKGLGSTSEDKIRKLFEKRGCEYIGPYVNNKTPTKYVCSCGKEEEVKVHSIKETWKGCRECSYKTRAEVLRK
ncbi:hypothetical protein [Brazilian marseillevirus]|uniref:hypothetical protein n=1 Tax=Brazilian marseillevirus TaxID=1813599 RepID=UPI00078135F0|nr:hypothetical protein A3303_gp398 [Brazilian marseillevirus]AMQ10906.1 hypothetical protein [Brazilian marseillevirus]